MAFVWATADGEPLLAESIAKGREEEVEGDQTRLLHVLTGVGSCARTCGVALKRLVEK